MIDWSVFDNTKLPPIEAFYSKLSDSDISENDYTHAQKVWETFNIKTLAKIFIALRMCYYLPIYSKILEI
jgi:hypothetical protein